EVAGEQLQFRRAVVATGSRPSVPPIQGLASSSYLTSDNVFDLDIQPRRLLVIGAGPIGCEMSQAFARFGTDVVLFDVSARVLPNDDPDAAAIVERVLHRDGVRLELGGTVTDITAGPGGARVAIARRDGTREEIAGDRLLVAAGRTPVVDGLA